jgi:hypothetical protein
MKLSMKLKGEDEALRMDIGASVGEDKLLGGLPVEISHTTRGCSAVLGCCAVPVGAFLATTLI